MLGVRAATVRGVVLLVLVASLMFAPAMIAGWRRFDPAISHPQRIGVLILSLAIGVGLVALVNWARIELT